MAACVTGVCPSPTVSLAFSARVSSGMTALNRRCLTCSHTMITAEQVLAVELEPPATGAGGRSLSPRKTETFARGTPSFSDAACAITV